MEGQKQNIVEQSETLHFISEPHHDFEGHKEFGQAETEPNAESDSTEMTFDGYWSGEANETFSLSPTLLNPKRSSGMDPPNPSFLKPFELGWKREVVYRNPTCDNKRRVDVYYYTPCGKKLRSLRNIADYLEGTALNLENFSFNKKSVGIDDPDKEIIRNAKRSFSDSSYSFSKKSKRAHKRARHLSGTPRIVFKNALDVSNNSLLQVPEDDLNDENCSWLPPMWGKLLSILNREH